jgi:hypothetical protein
MGIYFVFGGITNTEFGKRTSFELEIGTVLTLYSLLSTYLVIVYRAILTFSVSTTNLGIAGCGSCDEFSSSKRGDNNL